MSRSTSPTMSLGVDLDEKTSDFRAELHGWLAEHVPGPEPRDEIERFEFRRAWQRELAEAGWAGISWPEKYGGRGAGPLEQFVYYEELARAKAPLLADPPGLLLLGPTLMVHGTEELKAQLLPRILHADDIWCQGFSEPASGSDLVSVKTAASLVDGEWVVEGAKIWTSFAPYADLCFVLCRTSPVAEGGRRYDGLSLLIVPVKQPGVVVAPIKQPTGDSEFAQVFFNGAKTPAGHIVGEPDNGWRVSLTLLGFERADQGFTDHGRIFAMLDEIHRFLEQASSEGAIAADDEAAIRKRFTDAWYRCQLLCQFNLGRALALERGEQPGSWGSVIKLYWSELWQAVAELGLDLVGEDGVAERDWMFEFLATRATTIYSGTSEIQRNVIGDRILGLPR